MAASGAPSASGVQAELQALRHCPRLQNLLRINRPRDGPLPDRSSLPRRSESGQLLELDEETMAEVSKSRAAVRDMFESNTRHKITFGGGGASGGGLKRAESDDLGARYYRKQHFFKKYFFYYYPGPSWLAASLILDSPSASGCLRQSTSTLTSSRRTRSWRTATSRGQRAGEENKYEFLFPETITVYNLAWRPKGCRCWESSSSSSNNNNNNNNNNSHNRGPTPCSTHSPRTS